MRAVTPWRLDLVGAHVQPMKWMLAVQSSQQAAATMAMQPTRRPLSLPMPRLARAAIPSRALR